MKIKDIEIHALDAFDRTALITLPADQKAAGVLPDGMDERAVARQVVSAIGTVIHVERAGDGIRRIAGLARPVLADGRLAMEEQ